MKTYALMLQKGGTSRSSTVGNVSYFLSQHSKVCIVDCDVQGNVSSWLLGSKPIKHELVNVLQGDVEINNVIYEVSENLFIIPTFTGSRKLAVYKDTVLIQEPLILDDMNNELEKLGFDYVIYDTAPALSQMERSIIFAVDEVVAVLKPEYFSYDGLEIFEEFIKTVDKAYRKKPATKNHKLILSIFNASFKNHRINRERANRLDYDIYLIPQDTNVEKAQEQHMPLFEFDKNSRAIPAYKEIAEALTNGN